MKIARVLIGVILMALGIAGLLVDYDGIRLAHGGALHAINAAVELSLIAAGLICMLPAVAMEIAKDLPLFGKAVTAIRQGGQRESDPPPPPGGP